MAMEISISFFKNINISKNLFFFFLIEQELYRHPVQDGSAGIY